MLKSTLDCSGNSTSVFYFGFVLKSGQEINIKKTNVMLTAEKKYINTSCMYKNKRRITRACKKFKIFRTHDNRRWKV